MPDFLSSPLTYAVLLALLFLCFQRRLPRAGRYVLLFVEALLVGIMTPFGANLLVHAVEWREPVACVGAQPRVIVVLSGGLDRPARSAADYSALTKSSLDRLFAAVALWREYPGQRLVITGGGVRRGVAESVVLAELAHQLGVPSDLIQTETRARTTWENASNLAAAEPSLPRRIWLVSSSLHLPRAVGVFRAFGFEPCAWSSGSSYVPFTGSVGYFVPQTSALMKADRAIHELLGGWVYAWRASRMPSNHKP